MQDIAITIKEYKSSCEKVRKRIEQLTAQIDNARRGDLPLKELMDRRCLLYTELADMQYAVKCMEEYRNPEGSISAAG